MKAKMGFVVLGMVMSAASFAGSKDCSIKLNLDPYSRKNDISLALIEYAERKASKIGCTISTDQLDQTKYTITLSHMYSCGTVKMTKFQKYMMNHSFDLGASGTLSDSNKQSLDHLDVYGFGFTLSNNEERIEELYEQKSVLKGKKMIRKLMKTIKKLEN